MAVLHDQIVIAGVQADADHDDGKQAVGQRRARAEGHQRVHAGGTGLDALPARDEEGAVDPADWQGQGQLGACKQNGVPTAAVEHAAQRQADHVAHRDIHEGNEKTQTGNQAFFQLRGLGVLQLGVLAFGGGEGCAVPGGIHRLDDAFCGCVRVGIGCVIDLHGVGQQADSDGCNPRHSRHGFFHMACAGRAAHAGDVIALHGEGLLLVKW